ncbi:MAG: hypothetical protein V4488_10405 [Pseudomonadota bacterium]
MHVHTWSLQGIAAIIPAVLSLTLAVLLVKTLVHLFTGKHSQGNCCAADAQSRHRPAQAHKSLTA